jgi:hypothetical protein
MHQMTVDINQRSAVGFLPRHKKTGTEQIQSPENLQAAEHLDMRQRATPQHMQFIAP